MRTPGSNPTVRVIPEASLRRLPVYHHLLQEMMLSGIPIVSCTAIAAALNLDATQVRKDIEATGIVGKPKVGYSLDVLARWIENFLGWNSRNEAVLAGTGSLGSALLGYEKFRQLGFNLVAAFDTDPYKIGHWIASIKVLELDRLVEMARTMHIHLGVIATPSVAAQKVADLMVEGGIRAIWNFAPVHLRVPEFVILQNEDLYHSLASLSFRLEQMLLAERAIATASMEAAREAVPVDAQPEKPYAKED